jgi:hypothetical protein
MAVSTSDLVQRVRDNLGERPYSITCSTTTTATSITVSSTTGLAVGSILEWQASDYEQAYVSSVDSGTTLTVVRGHNGTTASTHANPTTMFVLTPASTSGRQITQRLTEALNELWPFVYKTGTVTLTGYASSTIWHNLNASTAGIVSVLQLYGSSDQYAGLFGERGGRPFVVNFGLPTGLVASGKGIRFPSGLYDDTNDITITDKRLVTGTSDIEDSGQFPVADCLVNWAVGLILQASEIQRVRAGESLDSAASVSTGQRLNTGAWYLNQGKKDLEKLAIIYEQHYQPVRMKRA